MKTLNSLLVNWFDTFSVYLEALGNNRGKCCRVLHTVESLIAGSPRKTTEHQFTKSLEFFSTTRLRSKSSFVPKNQEAKCYNET